MFDGMSRSLRPGKGCGGAGGGGVLCSGKRSAMWSRTSTDRFARGRLGDVRSERARPGEASWASAGRAFVGGVRSGKHSAMRCEPGHRQTLFRARGRRCSLGKCLSRRVGHSPSAWMRSARTRKYLAGKRSEASGLDYSGRNIRSGVRGRRWFLRRCGGFDVPRDQLGTERRRRSWLQVEWSAQLLDRDHSPNRHRLTPAGRTALPLRRPS